MKTFISTLVCLLLTSHIFAQVETKLTSPDGRNGDRFGAAVAMGEDFCLIGEPCNSVYQFVKRGIVYVYKKDLATGEWYVMNHINGNIPNGLYGSSISVDGDCAFVGAPGEDEMHGLVGVLQSNEHRRFSHVHSLYESNSNPTSLFGYSVSVDGDLAIVGNNTGSATIYKRDEFFWNEEVKLTSSDEGDLGGFGSGVALFDSTAIVSSNYKIYVYKKEANNWMEKTIIDSDLANMVLFGGQVALSNEYIIATADNSGVVSYFITSVFKQEGNTWIRKRLLSSEGLDLRIEGTSACINDSVLVIGNATDNDDTGNVIIFKRLGDDWIETKKLYASDGKAGDGFGTSVSMLKNQLVVGAQGIKPIFYQTWTTPGASYIYEGIVSGYLSISQANIDFENVEVGQSHSKILRVKNEGLENLNINSISFSGTGATSYSTDADTLILAPGETRNLLIRFSPLVLGAFEASVEINSGGGSKSISLIGNGSHTLSVLPHSINFGEIRVGEEPTKNLYIGNIGENSLSIDTMYIESSSTSDSVFKIDVDLPITIYGEGSKYIPVEFEPTDNLNYFATIKILSSVGDETVALSGTGFKAGIPQVWPDTIFFGKARLGEQLTKPLTIGNLGADPIKVGPITITGSGAGDFRVDKDTVTVTNNPEIIYVSFFPGAEEAVTGKLNTNTNAGNHEIILTGSGIAEGYLDVTPDTLQFGDESVQVGSSKQLFVGNFGVVDVQVSSIHITGANAASFFVDASSLTLMPAGITRLNVAFIPLTEGQHSASLEFISDGGNISVPLSGNGIICTPEEKTIVTPSDGVDGLGGFGYSVAISGNKAIGGGYLNEEEEGAAYIFACNGTTWEQEEKLRPSNNSLYMDFGRSVDISGNYAIVGAPNYKKNIHGRHEGAAYIFSKQFIAGWNEVDMLEVENEYFVNAHFGQAVAIDGHTAIIGAPGASIFPNANEGAAYIFNGASPAGGKGWSMLNMLTAPDAKQNYSFGRSVDISGNYAIAGTAAYGAYIFSSSNPTGGGAWHLIEKLMSSDFHTNDFFGYNVSISGDYALVSAHVKPASTMEGAVYAFKRIGHKWVEIAKLKSPYPRYQEQFGNSISLSGDFALIGTWDQETVYLFQREEDNTWVHIETLYDDGIDPADGFGNSVALDAYAGKGIVGVSGDFVNGVHAGSAFIYSAFNTVQTGVDKPEFVSESLLNQNYPNPFSSNTIISFNVETRAMVSLRIFDILGKEIEILVNEVLPEGDYDIIFNAHDLPNGIYLCKLQTGRSTGVKRMLLLK